MDATVPRGAALLLDFIARPESGGGYDVIYGEHQGRLRKPITAMSIAELLAAQKAWAAAWGSDAAGRYEIMAATLRGLVKALKLTGKEAFSASLQDRLAYQLLQQRGYAAFVARKITPAAFALALAEEWASLPVLAATQGAHRRVAAGETYYAGDRLNRALVSTAALAAVLAQALAAGIAPVIKSVVPAPPAAASPVIKSVVPLPAAAPKSPPAAPAPAKPSLWRRFLALFHL